MLKKCSKCLCELVLDDFNLDKRYEFGRSNTCKLCRRKMNADYYRIHGKHKSKVDGTNYLNSLKASGCSAKCGCMDVICMDFHHVRDKSFGIGERKSLNKALVEEVGKCIILCANCHRKHHAGLLDISGIPTLNPPTIEEFCNS